MPFTYWSFASVVEDDRRLLTSFEGPISKKIGSDVIVVAFDVKRMANGYWVGRLDYMLTDDEVRSVMLEGTFQELVDAQLMQARQGRTGRKVAHEVRKFVQDIVLIDVDLEGPGYGRDL
jgi:hypothetical protein